MRFQPTEKGEKGTSAKVGATKMRLSKKADVELSSAKRIDALNSRMGNVEAELLAVKQLLSERLAIPTNTSGQASHVHSSAESLASAGASFSPNPSNLGVSIDSSTESVADSSIPAHTGGTVRDLPPMHVVFPLIQDFFDYFNSILPLFDQPSFVQCTKNLYSPTAPDDVGPWAALNVALALSHRLRATSIQRRRQEDQQASHYLRNAQSVIDQLSVRDTDLLGIQSLIGMTIFFQGTADLAPASILIATAVRLAHRLGIHREQNYEGLDPREALQRRRVFWLVYFLDKDISFAILQPPILHDDDFDTELPSSEPDLMTFDGTSGINFLRLRVEMALIQQKVYRNLYSLQSSKQTGDERLLHMWEMDGLLRDWKRKIPAAFQPEALVTSLDRPAIVHLVILHMTYFNCIVHVHRLLSMDESWTGSIMEAADTEASSLAEQTRSPTWSFVVSEARTALKLLPLMPQGDYICIW